MHQEHCRYEIHSLAVACLRVVRGVGLEHIEQPVVPSGVRYLELGIPWECTRQVLLYLECHSVVLFVDELLDDVFLVLAFGVGHLADEFPDGSAQSAALSLL